MGAIRHAKALNLLRTVVQQIESADSAGPTYHLHAAFREARAPCAEIRQMLTDKVTLSAVYGAAEQRVLKAAEAIDVAAASVEANPGVVDYAVRVSREAWAYAVE